MLALNTFFFYVYIYSLDLNILGHCNGILNMSGLWWGLACIPEMWLRYFWCVFAFDLLLTFECFVVQLNLGLYLVNWVLIWSLNESVQLYELLVYYCTVSRGTFLGLVGPF